MIYQRNHKPLVIFCPKCGAGNDQDAKFCTNCANTLTSFTPAPKHTILTPVQVVGFNQGYFDLDNFVSGLKNIIKNRFKHGFAIYLTYLGILYILAIYISKPIIDAIYRSLPDDLLVAELIQEFLPNVITIIILSLIIGLFQWIPDTLYFRVLSNYENNIDEDLLESISYSLTRYFNYILVKLLIFGIMLVIIILPIMLVGFAFSLINSAFVIIFVFILIIALIILPFYLNLKFYVASPLVAVENYSTIDAIKKSWHLSVGNMTNFLIVTIILGIFSSLLSSLINRIMLYFIVSFSSMNLFIVGWIISYLIMVQLNNMVGYAFLVYTQLYHQEKTSSRIFLPKNYNV